MPPPGRMFEIIKYYQLKKLSRETGSFLRAAAVHNAPKWQTQLLCFPRSRLKTNLFFPAMMTLAMSDA